MNTLGTRRWPLQLLLLSAPIMTLAANAPFNDLPAGPRSLPGDLLPPFNMLDDRGQFKPMPKLDPALHAEAGRPVETAPGPGMKLAEELARAVVMACSSKGFAIGAAVVDSAGEARAMLSADGTDGSHVFVAMRKALVSVAFGMTSAEAGMQLNAGKLPLSKVTPAMFVAGGAVPILRQGRLIGAVAASGAAGNGPYLGFEDENCAKTGLARYAAQLK